MFSNWERLGVCLFDNLLDCCLYQFSESSIKADNIGVEPIRSNTIYNHSYNLPYLMYGFKAGKVGFEPTY